MTLSLHWISYLFLISIRLGTVLLFTPIQAIRLLPITVRLILIFTLSVLMIHYVPALNNMNDSTLYLSGLAEFLNGLILATSVYAAFAVFQIAGQLIDNAMGLNTLAIFNPTEHSQDSFSSQLLTLLAVLFFFNMQGHIWLFKSLAYSFTLYPPGSLILFAGFNPIIKQFAFTFSMSFMIASPILVALLAVDLCALLFARNMPQMNTYFLILPLKIGLGLFLLFLMSRTIYPWMHNVLDYCFHIWQEVMS